RSFNYDLNFQLAVKKLKRCFHDFYAGLKTSSDSKNEDKNHIWEWLNSFCILVRGALQCFKFEGKIPQNPNEDKNSFCILVRGALQCFKIEESEIPEVINYNAGLKTSSDSTNEDKNNIWEWLNSFCILVRGALQCFKIEGKIPQNPNEDKNSFCILVRGALQCFKIEESEIPELINYNAGMKNFILLHMIFMKSLIKINCAY
ncbi:unnamed protein product, partial [Callosobruchus maculatus]